MTKAGLIAVIMMSAVGATPTYARDLGPEKDCAADGWTTVQRSEGASLEVTHNKGVKKEIVCQEGFLAVLQKCSAKPNLKRLRCVATK